MKVEELIAKSPFSVLSTGDTSKEIQQPFCCDLLSIAMSKAKANSAWVTVMGNMNTLAVATLTDISCVILAEGALLDAAALDKAKAENMNILATDLPIFEAAHLVDQLLNEEHRI